MRRLEAEGDGRITARGSALLSVYVITQIVFLLVLEDTVDAVVAVDVIVNA